MKYLKYFEALNDVYELSVNKIKDDDFNVEYTFSDDKSNDFLVQFKNISSKVMDRKILGKEYTMSYFVKNGTICGEDNWSVSKLANSNPLRIVKTVFGKIATDFLNEKSWCNKLHIEGLSKDNEKDFVSQRTKMYVRYLIQNPIKGFKMETPRDINSIYSNKIVLKKIIKMKYLKYFESIDSDKRAFIKWEQSLKDHEKMHSETLFQFFLKHRPKLSDKNIFSYESKWDLEEALKKTVNNVSVKAFQKDISKWEKLKLNCDILYKSDDYVVLHSKDFETEYTLSSGCHICSTSKSIYDNYIRNGYYFFDILDLKNNGRYFGEISKDKEHYTVFSKGNGIILKKINFENNWEDLRGRESGIEILGTEKLEEITNLIEKIILKNHE